HLTLPDHLSGIGIDRHQVAIETAEEEGMSRDGETPIDETAADRQSGREIPRVGPNNSTRFRVHSDHCGRRFGDEYCPASNNPRHLNLALADAELTRPTQPKLRDIATPNLSERTVAPATERARIAQPFA